MATEEHEPTSMAILLFAAGMGAGGFLTALLFGLAVTGGFFHSA